MSYATQADMITRFGEREVIALADRDQDGVIDAAVISWAIDAAGDEIDGYLSARYTLPLATLPPLLTGICCDITRYRLCGTDVQTTEEIRDRYKDAIKMLGMVRDGKLSLGLDAADQPVATADSVRVAAGESVFDANGLSGF